MWIMEIGEGGFCSDRLVELINYCVAGDGIGEESELCSWGWEDSNSHGGDLGALALSSKDYPCSVEGTAKGKYGEEDFGSTP